MTRSKLRRLRIKANRIARSEAQKWPQFMGFDTGDQWRIVRVPRARWFARARRTALECTLSGGWRSIRPGVSTTIAALSALARRWTGPILEAQDLYLSPSSYAVIQSRGGA